MSDINAIQKKLQQLQEMGSKGDATGYQFTLQLLFGDVDAYNKRNIKTLRFKYCTNPGDKVYGQYSTFPDQLSEQLKKLE